MNGAIHVGRKREVYRGQNVIQWNNFIRGRVHKEWHIFQKRNPGEDLLPPSAWQFGLVELVLKLLMNKWNLRCDMVAIEELETERLQFMAEYEAIARSPEWGNLGEGDIYLTEERSKPNQDIPLGILKELVQTCRAKTSGCKGTRVCWDRKSAERWRRGHHGYLIE